MKSILISIQPKWCELIANGKKTVEVRKTKPKLETPFKVYIYCTMGGLPKHIYKENLEKESIYANHPDIINGKVIGEFVCKDIEEFQAEFTDLIYFDSQNENVCQNTIKRVAWLEDENDPYYFYETSNEEDSPNDCELLRESCLTFDEIRRYIGETFYDKSFYGWHISDLVIYDKPKELSEFSKPYGTIRKAFESQFITRPPQSWCYVEEFGVK